tara:strand:- start:10591 stop:12453 length:1863 start_codon:yes stop_codon:yes gene_type:complete
MGISTFIPNGNILEITKTNYYQSNQPPHWVFSRVYMNGVSFRIRAYNDLNTFYISGVDTIHTPSTTKWTISMETTIDERWKFNMYAGEDNDTNFVSFTYGKQTNRMFNDFIITFDFKFTSASSNSNKICFYMNGKYHGCIYDEEKKVSKIESFDTLRFHSNIHGNTVFDHFQMDINKTWSDKDVMDKYYEFVKDYELYSSSLKNYKSKLLFTRKFRTYDSSTITGPSSVLHRLEEIVKLRSQNYDGIDMFDNDSDYTVWEDGTIFSEYNFTNNDRINDISEIHIYFFYYIPTIDNPPKAVKLQGYPIIDIRTLDEDYNETFYFKLDYNSNDGNLEIYMKIFDVMTMLGSFQMIQLNQIKIKYDDYYLYIYGNGEEIYKSYSHLENPQHLEDLVVRYFKPDFNSRLTYLPRIDVYGYDNPTHFEIHHKQFFIPQHIITNISDYTVDIYSSVDPTNYIYQPKIELYNFFSFRIRLVGDFLMNSDDLFKITGKGNIGGSTQEIWKIDIVPPTSSNNPTSIYWSGLLSETTIEDISTTTISETQNFKTHDFIFQFKRQVMEIVYNGIIISENVSGYLLSKHATHHIELKFNNSDNYMFPQFMEFLLNRVWSNDYTSNVLYLNLD